MIRPSKADIEKLSRTDATVHACLQAHRGLRGITWEQTLSAMVIYLAEEKRAFVAAETYRRAHAPIVVSIGEGVAR